jgi:tetratricopeptide (TPR) repeat protein
MLKGLVAAAAALSSSGELRAQTPSDYYHALATGTGGLQAVEQYHVRPGEQALRTRWYDKALAEAFYILNLFPNHPQGLILLAQTCEQSRLPKCRVDDAFQKAIAINSKAAGTYIAQGIYFHRNRRYPDAIESFKQALALDSNSLNAHYNLGLAYLETKQYPLANEHAQRAYALGAPVPGLRRRLEQLGYWKPIPVQEAPAAGAAAQPPGTPPDAADKQ